jgi:hypothetical protein
VRRIVRRNVRRSCIRDGVANRSIVRRIIRESLLFLFLLRFPSAAAFRFLLFDPFPFGILVSLLVYGFLQMTAGGR